MNKKYYQYTSPELSSLFEEININNKVQSLVNFQVFKNSNFNIQSFENISQSNKESIIKNFDFTLPKIIIANESKDGTIKFLISLEDKNTIETVIIPGKNRSTICLSSQVGCAVGCTFCHTATQGFKRNLTVDEIVGQYLVAQKWLKDNIKVPISNIVFMGQGEPLNNFKNVSKSISIFIDSKLIGISKNKVTISTSGLVPQILKWDTFPDVNVAISLHASRNDLRSELMPINNRHNLEKLFEAIKNIPAKNSKKISFEYLLIKDVNDQDEDIEGLIKLLDKRTAKINIIPFNEYPQSHFKSPSPQRVKSFQQALHTHGYTCTIRKAMGDDILAACGQLKSLEETKVN